MSLCGSPIRPVMILALAIGVVLVTNWFGVFDLLIFAGSFSVVLYPLRKRLGDHVPPPAASAIIATTVLAAIFAAGYAILSVLDRNLGLIGNLVDKIRSWLINPSVGTPIPGIPLTNLPVGEWLNQAEAAFQQYWSGVMGNLSGIFIRVALFCLMVFLILWKGDPIWAVLRSVAAPRHRLLVDRLALVATDTVYALYVVHAIMAGVTFIISIPFFFILGYGHVLFYSFVSAIAELVPVLGSSVVMIFFGAYALAIGDPRGLFITVIIGYIGVSALPEIMIRPVLMGRRVELHPVVMFIGFFGGLLTLGMVGFVIGPVAIALSITAYRMYRHSPATAGT